MGAPRQQERTCKRCGRKMNRYFFFYSPDDDVCKECNPDVNFMKAMRKLAREKGVDELFRRMEDLKRRMDLIHEVIDELQKKGVTQ